MNKGDGWLSKLSHRDRNWVMRCMNARSGWWRLAGWIIILFAVVDLLVMGGETRFKKGTGLEELLDGVAFLIILGIACLSRSRVIRVLQATVFQPQSVAEDATKKSGGTTQMTGRDDNGSIG